MRAIRVPDVSPRDQRAHCTTCGRRGTWALITFVDAPVTVERYCRRCWPRAHQRHLSDTWSAVATHREASRQWMHRAGEVAPEVPPALRGRVLMWHWSLTPGTWWRALRYEREGGRRVRLAAT